jgi:pantothenate synthetase
LGRAKANNLYAGLLKVVEGLKNNGNNIEDLCNVVISDFDPDFKIDYLAVVDPILLKSLKTFDPAKGCVVLIAAYLEGVRLLDNLVISPQH